MSDRFKKAIVFVLDAEGGYTNDPVDPGGETNFGIDKRSHPNTDIKNLTKELATDIYLNEYWTKFGCDRFAWPVDLVYFDCCVNTGQKQANKILQRAVNTEADGVIGPKTLKAVSESDPISLADKMIDKRQAFYEALAKQRPKLKKFLKGWSNRNTNLKKFIKKAGF